MCYRLSYIIAKELLCVIDYYAFGTSMPGRKYESGLYRYGFNGKENDANGEFGSQLIQDYGFRMYNPAIAKFLSVDPLTASYPMLTPYQFASNSPIAHLDLDGLEHIYYKLTKLDDGETNLELIKSVPTGKNLIGSGTHKLPELHYVEYQGEIYPFQGAKMNLLTSNEASSFAYFITDPDKAISTGHAKTKKELYYDFFIYSMQQEVFEQAGAQFTFKVPRAKPKVGKAGAGAEVGTAIRQNYRKTFFEGTNITDKGKQAKLVIHHAVEQQVLRKYPSLFSEVEINSFRNLRGIPVEINNTVHLSAIRKIWDGFYEAMPNPTRADLLKQATKIDDIFGSQFFPKVSKSTEEVFQGAFNGARGFILLFGLEVNEAREEKKRSINP